MKISLNGLDLPKTAEGTMAVKDVLRELRAEIHASGKLMLKVILDGVPLPDNWEQDYRANTPVNLAVHLELIIDDPKHASRQLLKDSCALIEKLTLKTGDLARKFRVGSEVAANNELVQFLDDLKLIIVGLDMTTKNNSGHPEYSRIRGEMEQSAKILAPTLDRIYHAQSSGDTVTIADEIQYELPGQMDQWKAMLDEAAQIVNTPDKSI